MSGISGNSSGKSGKRSAMRPHSAYDTELYRVVHSGRGVEIQCQFCPGQAFRRSRLRSQDVKHLFMMRYPVRCLRCSQRQMVSFTVAGVAVPSNVKQRRARHVLAAQKHWSEPAKTADGQDSGPTETAPPEGREGAA